MESFISTHVFLPRHTISGLDFLKEKLSITSKYGGESIPTYKETGTHFGIPLYYPELMSYVNGHYIHDRRTDGNPVDFKFTSTLRPNQQLLMDGFKRYIIGGDTGIVLDALPGFGKTVLLLSMLSHLKRTALVVVQKSDLVDQWVERICHPTKGHTDIPRERIGVISGGEWDEPEGKDIFIALVHTLNLERFPEKFKNYFGVVVFDEVDRSVPPATFAPVMSLFPSKFRIGASATVTRNDGLHLILDYHIGEKVLTASDEGRMKPSVIIHRYKGTSGKIYGNSKLARRGVLLSKLSKNMERNELIAKYTNLIYKTDRRVIVISDRTEQLAKINFMLRSRYGIPKEDIGYYVRQLSETPDTKRAITEKERKHTAKFCKIILATYGMMKIGTDIPDLAGLVYATPQTDITQVKGRIERMFKDKQVPVIIDIIDTHYSETVGSGANRLRQYRSEQLNIKEY